MFWDDNGLPIFLATKSLINNDFKTHEKLVIEKSVMVNDGKHQQSVLAIKSLHNPWF